MPKPMWAGLGGGPNPLNPNAASGGTVAGNLLGVGAGAGTQAGQILGGAGGGVQSLGATQGAAQGGTALQGAAQGGASLQGTQGAGTTQGAQGGGATAQGTTTAWKDLGNDMWRRIFADANAAGINTLNPKDWYESGGWSAWTAANGGGGGGGGGGDPTPPPTLPDALGGLLGTMFPGSPGPASPFTPEMMNFLPGRSAGGETAQSLLLNTLLNQFLQQGPRSQQAEDIFGGVLNAGVNSPAYGLSQDAASMARGRIQPGALDAYESQLRTQAASDAGQGYQSSMQRLRDAGQFGRGAMGVDPTLAASNLANQGLQRANTDISGIMESLTQNRLGQASDLSRSGAAVFQSLGMAPAYNYANRLSTQKNAALSPFLEQLNMLSQMAITGDVASRAQPSDFERIGLPLIMGGLDLAQSVFSKGMGNKIDLPTGGQ